MGSSSHLRGDHVDLIVDSWPPSCEISMEQFPYTDLEDQDIVLIFLILSHLSFFLDLTEDNTQQQ